MAVTPREEAETIISYDAYLNEWHYYSDVPKHNRKWRGQIGVERETVEENGTISMLEGKITGNVAISKKRVMTEEQKKVKREQLARLRQDRINSNS